jgi:hypothetical protein
MASRWIFFHPALDVRVLQIRGKKYVVVFNIGVHDFTAMRVSDAT